MDTSKSSSLKIVMANQIWKKLLPLIEKLYCTILELACFLHVLLQCPHSHVIELQQNFYLLKVDDLLGHEHLLVGFFHE